MTHRREIDSLKRRVLNLAERDRIEVYRAMRESLEATVPTSVADVQNERRAEALRVLDAVVAHLGLDDDGKRKLTMGEFNAVPEQVREGWTAARVARAFGGTWRHAQLVMLGERLPVNLEQRQIRRQAALREKLYEGHIEGLRMWLATEPASLDEATYDAWVESWNAERDPTLRKLVKAVTITKGRSWADALRGARNEKSEGADDDEKAEPVPDASEELADFDPTLDARVLDPQLIGRRIYYARVSRGMNLATLTKKAELSDGQLSRIEQATRTEQKFWTLAKIAIALRVPLDLFLTPDGRRGRPPRGRATRVSRRPKKKSESDG